MIHKLKGYFARHGIPDKLRSENGPHFTSKKFARFVHEWQFKHITSSSHYPQSNGKMENSVKSCKALMKTTIKAKSNIYLALLDFRNTPTEKMHSSPAQRLFGRRTKTQLLMSKNCCYQKQYHLEKSEKIYTKAKSLMQSSMIRSQKLLSPIDPRNTVPIFG